MAHTSEQTPTEGGQNATTASVGSSNTPTPSTAARPSSQPTPATATSTSQQTENEDKEYNPSAEAMIDDIDDERTLEEEEALAAENPAAVQNELDDLKRESEMPIEELLAYYQRMREQEGEEDELEEGDDDDDEEEEEEMDDEGEDEVRKRRHSGHSTDVKTLSHRNQLATGSQSTQQQSTTTQAQVTSSLANTHLLSPSKQTQQINPQQQQPADLNPSQDTQTTLVDSDGAQRSRQQSSLAQTPQIDPDHYQSNAYAPAVQEHTIDIECIDEPRANFQGHAEQANVQLANRHKRSMTEFLVDSGNSTSNMLKTFLDCDLDDSDDLDEDYAYTDDENVEDERDWRRVIHVGPDYQAEVPEGLSKYENDLPPYENQDTLVWKCNPEQTKEELIDYLKRASAIPRRNDISISPASVPKISIQNMRLYRERMQGYDSNRVANSGEINFENPPENLRDVYMSQSRKRLRIDIELEQENAMDGMNQPNVDAATSLQQSFNPNKEENSSSVSQDNRPELSTEEYFHGEEQLLYLLLQCNHNFEEALRRRRLDPFKYYIAEPMSLWSQEECLGFEHGLQTYGKNFYLIRETKVPTRSRGEVVAFYYLWKKSERHDVYTTQYKLDRKRSLTHPGTTDYMDKFIEDNGTELNASATQTPTPTESTVSTAEQSQFNVLSALGQSSQRRPDW